MSDKLIKFKCSNCGKGIAANENLSGKKGKCPACGTILTIPQRVTIGPEDQKRSKPPAPPETSRTGVPDLKGKKVLLVDDDKDFLKLMKIRLKPTGCELITAQDGLSATTIARKEKPDMILLDIGLPAGDGFVLLKRWANTIAVSTPIIVITSWDPTTVKEKALDAGAEAFVQKTAGINELFSTIQEVMG